MSAISLQEFFSERGSIFSQADAEKIGPALQELSQDGALREETVVEVARSTNSPLNPYFEWNDKRAAHQYRLGQARTMMSAIRVRYADGSGQVRIAKAFQIGRRPAASSAGSSPHRFKVLDDDSAFAAQMMDAALEDLKTWRLRYEAYQDTWSKFGDAFQEVSNQISEFEEEVGQLSLASNTDASFSRLLEWRQQSIDLMKAWVGCREQVNYIDEAIKGAEQKVAKLNVMKIRRCIKCETEFKSTHAGNRMCQRCAITASASFEEADVEQI